MLDSPWARQIERNEATILRDLTLHLMTEDATTKRIAMDQQHWYAAFTGLLNCENRYALPSRVDDHIVAVSAVRGYAVFGRDAVDWL